MPKYKPLYSLYKGLKESKYDVPDSYISFQKTLTQAGDAGAKSRRGLYQSLKDSNYDVPDTYEDFYKNLFVPVNSTTSRALKIGENPNTPTVNRYRQKMFDSVDPNKNGLNALSHRAVGQAVRATNNVRKPVVAKVVNRNGKPTGEEFAITPAKTVEDLDREYAQAVSKNWENELHDQMADADKDAAKISDMFKSFIGSTDEVGSVWGNITRGGGIAGTPHSVTTNNGILENTEARQILAAGDYNRKRRELLQLEQDSRLSKDTSLLGGVKKAYNDIKNGEFSKAGKDLVYGAGFDNHSFFRGMYDAAKDTGFLTGGVSDLINAGSLLATKQDLDNGIHTEAGDMLMQQAVKNSNAQSQYGDNQGWMYTGGVITTNMAPFMVQIASAGFSKGMSTAIGKGVQGAASKVALGTMKKAAGYVGADLAKNIGKLTGLSTKAFGRAVQYGIVGAAQANTVGIGNVANDVINRYTGQVYQDEQGDYKFGTFDSDGKLVHEGGEDFLTALVKGEAAQTIEFATELAGGGIDAAGTALKNFVTKGGKKIINKYNMENVSKVIDFLLNNKVSKNARYLKAGADRTLGKVEVNSIVGESLEEELGIIANTVFTGDNKISDLWDEKQQSQIWGGMLLSIGLMKGAVAPFHAYNAKQYYSYKHKLDKADVNLSQLLGKEKWEELRNQIDATTNDDMPEMVNKINRDVALGKNRQPVREYIQNLLIMRGYDIGNMLAAKKAVEDKGEGVSVKNMEKNQAYQQGRDAYGYDTHEIQLDQEEKQKSLAQLLGISEQQLASMSDEELEALSGRDDNIDRAIYDYQLSTARYEGVIDNARDQIDLEVQRAAQAVDMYTDKSRNTIRNATIKATGGLEDYGVYIINGNIATHEDGSIDISNSDDMILYYDPTTNTVEHADAMMFAELGSEENADEVRSQAMADAKEKAIKETTGIIDGVVEVGTQFKTVDADGTEHTYEVLADNGDGTAMITIDGNIPTELVKGENVNVPVSFEELQKMKDESDQQRLQAAKAQREQMEKERAEQQMQAQTTQAENPSQEDNIQPAPIEDNLDYSDIIRDDGKVQMVDVSDKDGNNLFPDAKDVFYIQGNKMRTKFAYIDANGELKTQSFPAGLVKIKTRGEVSVDDYKKYRNMILSAESSAMPETSMIEDNSGSIEADRGGIEVEDNTQPLSEADADNVIAQMESSAETAPDLELTPDNWTAEFGEDGILSTPVGDVKMGENQVAKLFEKGRSKEFGMIKPTLTNPDVIIEVPSHSADGNEERSSSYLFIKTFLGKNGKKVYYFKSVTIKKDGLEISISSHYDRAKRVKEALMKGKLLYRKNDGAQTEQNQPSTSVTTSQEDAAGSSESKDTNISSNGNENNESLTFEDGTPIPVDVNGEVDLSQTDASHAAEWYDTNLGEDADDWLDGEIKKAKKVLEQAKNKKVTGTKPSELVASKKEKEAAIADAQAHYDSAISIRDSLKERRIAKEENTSDGRRNLIEKARRKFARLKSAVKDDAEAVAQIYKETVGTLLHRLYDGTGIDVTDTIPLTAEEYVASNLGAHSLNYEGTETSKGVKQETGLSREDFAKTQLLAADGKGTTIDNLVHSLWENRPSNLDSLDTQDIRNAMLSVITSGFKASEARNYIENLRIAQAENILEEQKKAADNAAFAEENKAESEQQTETAPESEEKTGEENSDEITDEENEKINEQTNENINAPEQNKFPDKLREGSKAIEVPEDATDENPLGLQLSEDKVPFEIEGGKSGETYNINDNEDRQRLINDNKVDDKDILDIDMPKHVHKAIKELCKKMGLKVQFLYMGARSNGWIENGTMYLALDTEKATQFVFGHEMTHAIKQKNPEAYKELVKVAMAVTTRKKFEEDLAKVYQNYYGISGYNNIDDYVEEVVADNLGKFINDFDLAQKFSLRLNHPVLATILHAIQKIKSLLYGDFYKSVDALERIVEKAYVDTANGQVTNSETGEDVSFSLRQKPEPKKKGVGYKVFVLKDGKLYPPMVANPDGAATPVGVWLDADAAPIAGESKTGRPQVKQGGKGTQGGSGKLAYRPGWHLGVVPYAIQFNRKDAEGNKTLFPKNFVFAEVEYAADVDYQEEARQEGINPSGKYQHSLAGLKHLPTDGYYMYRTNPNPETDPWVITGAMKVNRILTRAEQADLVSKAGREPQQIQESDIVTDDVVNSINQKIAAAPKFSLKVYHGSGASFDKFNLSHALEGEGSETFGHGVYVTNSKKIGDNYAQRAKDRKGKFGFDYKIDMSADAGQMLSHYINKNQDVDKGLENARQDLKSALEMFPDDETLKELSAILQKNNNEIAEASNEAYLYDVDIPDDNGENYLGWNESQNFPLEKWYRLWEITHHGFNENEYFKDGGANYDKDRIERIIQMKLDSPENGMQKLPTLKGEELYHALEDFFDRERPLRGAKLASRALSEIGFVGIKYPAGMIHGGAKEGDYNYVIFDENNANIVGNTRFSLRGSTPYDKQMEEWMEKNNLEKGAVPMEKPIMKEGENIFDYANRMVEWTRNQNLWKTAPKQTGFQDALDKWKADNGLSPDAYPPVRPHREYYSSEIGYAEDLEEYNKKKELWKSAPKPKDFDLSVDLEDMNKQLRNIRRAVLNQKNYDQRTVKAVSDLVRKMLNIGWGDGLSRGKVGNLLSAAKNATGANDVKKYLDKAMGILAENYLNRLSTAYDNLINTKGARADQSGVIKMGSLDAKGQAFMSEYKKAINMDDKSLNNYIANIEEDSAKNEDNVEMNDYRLAGIQAAIMYKQQIGGNDADIAELKKQIGELKNKKDATKEDKDLLKSLEKKLFENKFDRITMYENLLNNIQRMVKESKGRAKEFREEITEHKNEILHRANLDLEGVDSTYYDTTTAKKKLVNNDLQRAVFSSTYTFEQFLKFFGKKAANGEGYLYNYFTKLNQDALDEEQLYNEMNRNALDEKTKELFGKEKFMKLVGIDGKGMKEMDVEVTDYSNKETGKRTIHLKQGQMLYIYLVNKETDGEMKLRAMGITEEDVAAIEENLDPRVKAMGEWLQDEYLPECQRRYQATHTKYFGAPMKDVENYFPLAINNRARNVKEDVNQDSDAMSQLAGTSTGAIVTRRVNVIPLDIENADAFEVAFNHLQEMEEWSAMLPFRQDINTLLSYTHFRNQVQNMSSVAYGSGKTLWNEFKQTAQIAAGTYKPKVNAGMMDSRIAAAMGGIAVAKISGRLWTAIKQSQSATVFLPECDFTRFVKNGVNPYGSWKWAKENIPDFRKRIENITYGDVKLRQYLDELEKYHDWTKVISKWGMAPNILVDGITCAVGARSVYETEVNRLTKLGYPKEKAEEKAYYKAVAAYNKTQQSSGGMYLSPMQVDRTYVSAALSLFKNANYAYGRMQIEACRGLARTYDFWGGKHKTTLIEYMTRQIMEEDGLDENTARAIAKATYNRTFRQSIGRLINFATLVPVSWALYKVLPYLLTGDDDDKKKDMIEEAVLKGFATSLSDNYVIPFASNILNAGLKVEDGKPTFDPEVFRYQNLYINPATSDLANIYSMVGNQKWYSVANKLGMLGVQSLIGFNPETVGALYQALSEADYDNGNTAKEWQIGILKAISAPEESIRELYMDELGLKSGDIKKIPLAELEKRYAERQINRDNLLSQIGMDAETFNGYVDKYQKSFEKKIKDKMDKWDEYDKKKADEFFDTTSDHKLKDMIEKKRTKDANAAADEQIAKEGLNQEKKGKEPSEEAYDAVKMSIDVAEDNAISTYNKVLYKRYAALNDEYNNQTDAMKYIFMNKHPNFKAYKDLESEYTTYGKKMKELKEKLVSADGYDAKQTILKQIRAEREKFSELQSKVR